MSTLVTILHVSVCLFLMLTVLLQSGKGGGMGAAFGGGNAATVFGGSGASSFLQKLTVVAATIFMVTSMILAFLASHNADDALAGFGAQEAARAKQKADARAAGLKDGALSGSGSDSAITPDMGSGASMTPAVDPAVAPDPGDPATAPATTPAATTPTTTTTTTPTTTPTPAPSTAPTPVEAAPPAPPPPARH